MAADTRVLEILMRIKDQASGPLRGVQASVGGLVSGLSTLRGAFTALASAVVIQRLFQLTQHTLDLNLAIIRLSESTGVAVSELSKLAAAAKQDDVEIGELANSMKFLGRAVEDAKRGQQDTVAAFQALGISAKDLEQLSLDQVMLKIADAFEGAANNSAKAEIAIRLFGRAGDQMVQFLNRGSNGIKELQSRAEHFGETIGEESVSSIKEFDDAIDDLASAWSGLGQSFLEVSKDFLIPALQGLAESIRLIGIGMKTAKETARDFLETLGLVSSEREEFFREMEAKKGGLFSIPSIPGLDAGALPSLPTLPSAEEAAKFTKAIKDHETLLDKMKAARYEAIYDDISLATHNAISDVEGLRNEFISTLNSLRQFETIGLEGTEAQLKELEPLMLKYAQQLHAAGKAQYDLAKATEEKNKKLEDEQKILQSGSFAKNWDLAVQKFREFNEEAEAAIEIFHRLTFDLADDIADLVVNVANGTEKFKDAIKSLAISVISDINRIIVRMLVLKLIQALVGGGGGGETTTGGSDFPVPFPSSFQGGNIEPPKAEGGIFKGHFMPVRTFADGGIINRPTIGIVGEGSGPEAVIPLKGGKVPVQMQGGGGPAITVNIATNDVKSFEDALSRPGSRRRIRDLVREALVSDVPLRRQVGEIGA